MSQLAIDRDTMDLVRPLRLVTGIEEIAQDLWLRLQTFKGELVCDVNKGVPMAQEIVEKGTPPSRIAAIYRKKILETPGVTRFLAVDMGGGALSIGPVLELDPETRHLFISFRVETDEGELVFREPIAVAPLPEAA